MKFWLNWKTKAEDQLAEIWMRSSDRNAVNQAVNRLEHILPVSPETKGTDFYGDRILVIPPLQVVFVVSPEDLRVDILEVLAPGIAPEN